VGEERPAGAGWAEGRVGRKVGQAESEEKRISELKIGFLNLPMLLKFAQGYLGEILTCGFFLNSSRLLKDFKKIKYAMPCNASYTRFIFGRFSYVLQIDRHFICTPIWTKFYSCK
jgi:hypothetical protein